MRIYPKIALIAKNRLVTILFREVEQLVVYQLLHNLTI